MSPHLDALLERIAAKSAVIGVMGMGYVGLPLAATFHRAGFQVLGFDTDTTVVAALERGESYLEHLKHSGALFRHLAESQSFTATSDMTRLSEADAVLICVPTPLGEHFEPDLSYVEACGRGIAGTLRAGQLIVLESTTYPGTTRERLLPVLTAEHPEHADTIFVAFSPEREDPGNTTHVMATIPKLVGGLNTQSTVAAMALYQAAFDQVLPVARADVAEAAKLVENVYRAVNIALVNELKMVLSKMDIDIWDVLDAAETKPFGFQRFNPGPGWGGHCIPVDPFYLTWKARSVGMHTHFIERAGEINIQMPHYVVSHVQRALNDSRKPVNGARALLLGIAYKPNLGDTRETPAFVIWKLLREMKAEVSYYDPLVPEIRGHLSPDLAFLKGVRGVGDADVGRAVEEADVVVVVTPHKCFLDPVPASPQRRSSAASAKEGAGGGLLGAAEVEMDKGKGWGIESALKAYKGPVVDTRNWVPGDWNLCVYKA